MAGEHKGEFVTLQRTVVMGKADAAVKLRVTRQALLDTGHADEDHADAGSIEHVAQVLERRGREPLGLVDDEQFGGVGKSDFFRSLILFCSSLILNPIRSASRSNAFCSYFGR